jgi:hypothetical protein
MNCLRYCELRALGLSNRNACAGRAKGDKTAYGHQRALVLARRLAMKYVKLPLPEVALVAVTRGMLGAGAALLFGNKISRRRRKAVGLTLFLTGAISTVPLILGIRKQLAG